MTERTHRIMPGDTVLVAPHRIAPVLYPSQFYDHPAGGQEHVVEKMPLSLRSSDPNYYHDEQTVLLRYLTEGGEDFSWHFVHPCHLTVVKEGPGTFTEGVSVPYSRRELSVQRFQAYCERLDATMPPKVEGWANLATFEAFIQLNNDHSFHIQLRTMFRKDGTINPNKLQQAFRYRRMQVDPIALQPHVDVPPEFANYCIPMRLMRRYHVQWQEIADHYAAERKAKARAGL